MRPSPLFLVGASICMAMAAVLPAIAQNVTAEQPQTILDALKAGGLPGELDNSGDGPPVIASAHEGFPFAIALLDCDEQKTACKTMQFYFGVNDRKDFSLEQINRWNSGKRFVRSYRDRDSDPVLVMDVDTEMGGLSQPMFQESLRIWLNQIRDFRQFLIEETLSD